MTEECPLQCVRLRRYEYILRDGDGTVADRAIHSLRTECS